MKTPKRRDFLTVRLAPAETASIEWLAAERGVSISAFVRTTLADAVISRLRSVNE